MQDKNKVSLNIITNSSNSFKQAMQRVEKDFRSNTLDKELERLGINPKCLSESFKEELKSTDEVMEMLYGKEPEINEEDYRLSEEENEFLNNLEYPEHLFKN